MDFDVRAKKGRNLADLPITWTAHARILEIEKKARTRRWGPKCSVRGGSDLNNFICFERIIFEKKWEALEEGSRGINPFFFSSHFLSRLYNVFYGKFLNVLSMYSFNVIILLKKNAPFICRNNVANMRVNNPTYFKRRNYLKNIRVDTRTYFRRRNYVEKMRVYRTTLIESEY